MEKVEILKHSVDYLGRMLDDAVDAHDRIQTKYAKLDAERAMTDQQVAAAATDVEKAKKDLEAAKAEHLAAQDQHDAAAADIGQSDDEGEI